MEPEVAYLDYILKGIVSHPEQVSIKRTVDTMGVLLFVTVHKDDMGKVLGRGGQLADGALRPLMRVFGMKIGSRVNVKFGEPAGGKRSEEAKTVDEAVDSL